MNLPAICLLLLVLAYPVVYAGYLSLHRVGIAQLRRGVFPWNDWENYTRLFEDPLFALALKNTILFTVLVVAVEVILAIGIALLLNRSSRWTSRDVSYGDSPLRVSRSASIQQRTSWGALSARRGAT